MTIGSTIPARVSFNCDGVTKVFPIPIQAYQASDIEVILTAPAGSGGTETVLVLNSDYSMAASGTLNPTAWTLTTLVAAAYAAGYTLQAFINPVQSQQTSYVQGQAFPSLAVQTNMDRLTQMTQRLQDQLNRTVLAPDGDVSPGMGLPQASQRALTYLAFDANGNVLATPALPGTANTAASLGPILNPRTNAEIAAAVIPVNFAYPAGHILRYGTNTTPGTTDMTAALQAAANQNNLGNSAHSGGVAIYIPQGIYKISSTVTLYAGCKITGDGWVNQVGSFQPIGGTILYWTGNGTCLKINGVSTGNYAESLWIQGIAIWNQGGNVNNTGLQLLFAPFSIVDNCYIAGFTGSGAPGTNGVGIEQGNSSWQCTFRNVKIYDCTTCLYSHDAGEDSTHISCIYASYNVAIGVGLYAADQCQTTSLLGCGLNQNNFGLLVAQGDTNGNGTGVPLPVQLHLDTCQFENCTSAAVGVTVSNQSYANNKAYPSIVISQPRCFGGTSPNSGQAIIYAQAWSSIKISAPQESGYSFGGILATSQYGYTYTGTAAPGPILFENDTYTYGTSQLAGFKGTLIQIPGEHALIRLTSVAFAPSSASSIPFTTVVSDGWGWKYTGVGNAIRPTKNVTVRHKVNVAIAAAPATTYLLDLYKNGAFLFRMAAATVNTAGNAYVLSGEAYDLPNGTTDYYQIILTPGAAMTLDTTNSYWIAEVAGE